MANQALDPTNQTAQIYIKNNTQSTAYIALSHGDSNNDSNNQGDWWLANPGQTVGPLTVYFQTGSGSYFTFDYWEARLLVLEGSQQGAYVTSAPKECQLQASDAGASLTFTIDTQTLGINLNSSHTTQSMVQFPSVTNVFVLMLENHSFNNIFGGSGLPGITVAGSTASNTFQGTTYPVGAPAPTTMSTDPGHEFNDVVEQLAGQGHIYVPKSPYPSITSSGFVANYATSDSEETSLPSPQHYGDVMMCFDTPNQLPAIYALAKSFAVCDQWFSSMPGPTWPNRFFLHGASSSGLDDSPTEDEEVDWEATGFQYPQGSIYNQLDHKGLSYRFYNDAYHTGPQEGYSLYSDRSSEGSPAGAIPQVGAIAGISLLSINSVGNFASDLKGPYPYNYTFIEPHYGDVTNNTYAGGSSQHPMDDMAGGDNLIAAVYNAIRQSPLWPFSLLIITYDEHGGFYDPVKPLAAAAPGDNPNNSYNRNGFDFTQLGVRVPAVVVSPRIPAGTVDPNPHDHASVIATLTSVFNVQSLTTRDRSAHPLNHLMTLTTLRSDCPWSIQGPGPGAVATPRAALTVEQKAALDAQPLPAKGNTIGFLRIALKEDLELAAGNPAEQAAIMATYKAIKTRGQARAYMESVMTKVYAFKRAREQAKAATGTAGPSGGYRGT